MTQSTPVTTIESLRARLLVVSHEASQTGAPIVLANLLEWLHANTSVSVHTLLVEDGPLRSRFETVGTVSAVSELPGASTLSLLDRALVYRGNLRARKVVSLLRYKPALGRLGKFDLAYFNSLTTLEVLPFLRHGPKVVAHVHEGPITITEWTRAQGPSLDLSRPEKWIAVSEESATAIKSLPGVDPESVFLHHPFIDVAAIRRRPASMSDLAELRQSLGIPPHASIVLGMGSIERRKGPDLFVQLACEVRRRRPSDDAPVHFVWVGGDLEGPEWPLLRSEIKRNRGDHVHVTGHVSDPRPYFRLADVFALTSREDPFPLVCLESAASHTPVVAYSSSGIRDLLMNAGGAAADGVIQYSDVGSMADRVITLLHSPETADEAAALLAERVETHHDTSVIAPSLARHALL